MTARFFRHEIAFLLVAVIVALYFTRGLIAQPGYTDAFYYFNAANRLASGDSLTDAYLWTYIGASDSLPAPSHLYWMPLTSLMAAFGMWLLDAPGEYMAAQWPFTLLYVGTACIGFWLGRRLGGTMRHAWIAGLLTVFSGFFARFWGMTDTFAPFALVGSLALVFIALGTQQDKARWWLLAGLFAGLGHLTRADGLLLLGVGVIVLLWQLLGEKQRSTVFRNVGLILLGYLVIMTPWFLRNLTEVGTILPVGGAQSIWYTGYNDLFRYPPEVAPGELLEDGISSLVSSRWTALSNNLGTFIAVEGLIILTPLMLIGLWNRRRNTFLRGFWLYALLLHLAMTLVFPFPGYRGGLFHSVSALVPWWGALAVVGLDDVVDWMAQRRRTWKPRTAKRIFSAGMVVLALVLSFNLAQNNRVRVFTPSLYTRLIAALPDDARVMINDPAQLYYFTSLAGVVIPSASPDVVPQIAQKYEITHLLVEFVGGVPAVPSDFVFDFDNPPAYLTPVAVEHSNAKLYAIHTP